MSIFRSLAAVVAGYFAMVVGVTSFFAVVMFVVFGGPPEHPAEFEPPGWLLALELGATPLIGLVGGYVCAWIARRRELSHAMALAALALALGAVSAFAGGDAKPMWSNLAVPVLGAIGVIAGARLRIAQLKL